MQPLMNVIGNLSYVAVCVFGSVLAINGTIEFGVIVSFILYVRLFTTPLTQIAQGMTNLQTASAPRIVFSTSSKVKSLATRATRPRSSTPCAAR